MNRAGLKMIEADSLDQVKGLCVYPLVSEEFREAFRAMAAEVFKGESRTLEFKMIGLKGRPLWLYTHAVPLRNAAGEIVYTLATTIDITERKEAEEKLQLLEQERLKTQKLEAIGTLAGGIAHDFNNLLQGLFGYISLAKLNSAHPDKTRAMLEQAEQALQMTVNLTAQLLTFAKGGKPIKKVIALAPVIENAVKFTLSGSRILGKLALASDLWSVDADAGQIGQVIQNIVLNADQSMPEGGTIVVTARNLAAAPKAHPQLRQDGRYVELTIADNGIGIAGQYLQKIFDPYFTTKEKGSGLGLATSYSIIRNHGGVIDVASELGRGTTFYISLPAVEAVTEAVPRPAAPPSVGRRKILVMDDEDLVLEIAGKMLQTLGHDVEFAKHGQAAVEKYRAAADAGAPFDVVILDLTIRGGMGGQETIRHLLAIDSNIKAIVSSGYSDDAVISEYARFGFQACLSKPYQFEELRDTVHALLS